jgi:peptidoglycan/xylan/chitin deacetylase (PgdA/CDA1 family)
MYHDIIAAGALKSASGFNVKGADAYKISVEAFEQQVKYASEARDNKGIKIVFSFDDGGKTALETAVPVLEKYRFKGVFFIPTSYIGKPGFLNGDDILELYKNGHRIGSHSHTHPYQMSRMNYADIVAEWKESISIISEIIKSTPDSASVPGGWYNQKVARAASESGIRNLYTSKPTHTEKTEGDCNIYGRFAIRENTSFSLFKDIVDGKHSGREKMLLMWNIKQVVKMFY